MGNVNVRKRSNGWEYYFETASINGKRQRRSGGGFKTKKDALAAGTSAKAVYDGAGISFAPSEQSVADYLDWWIEHYAKNECAESTVAGYEKKIRLYIKPYIGDYKLKNITPAVLKQLMILLHRQKYSRNTLQAVKGILTGSFDYAVNTARFIAVDPTYKLTLPNIRLDEQVGTRKRDIDIVPPETWNSIITRFPYGHPAHLPLMLAYHCGLRLGECFAVTWDCVNFSERTLRINKQIQQVGGEWLFRIPKYNSKRTILLGNEMINLLDKMKNQQEKDKAYCGKYYTTYQFNYDESLQKILPDSERKETSIINIRQDGTFCQPRIMQHVGRVVHGKNNKSAVTIMENFEFHCLRHTHATMLLDAGVPMPVIQERLGHTKIETTKRYSNHITDNMHEKLSEIINNI